MAQAALEAPDDGFHAYLQQAANTLSNTRPTAQNLFYGIRTVLRAIEGEGDQISAARQAAVAAAQAVADDDAACCEAIGRHGDPLITASARVSTHCNAGWLVDETRPRGQGARLTAWELSQEGVSHAVIADNATGHLMAQGEIDMVIVGSDRIAANGDVANKIGTFSSAVVAAALGIPFYVAAPTTTIDPDCPSGDEIPIEERSGDELRFTWGWSDDGQFMRVRTTPAASPIRNPAFDVTPADLVAGIITEKGVVSASTTGIAAVARQS
jgi:methylthioribose-1-phosphate isomerase